MSRFLGPIHHWLYNKIQLQEEVISRIAEVAAENKWKSGEKSPADYVNKDDRPLDEVIDGNNIHGWLQGRIEDAEARYAALVAGIVKNNPDSFDRILDILKTFGEEQALPAESSAQEVYKKFDDTLLNGMPCDRVNAVVSNDDDAFAWEQSQDIHGQYWEEEGLGAGDYYALRTKFMEGMIEKTAYTLADEDHTRYTLRK